MPRHQSAGFSTHAGGPINLGFMQPLVGFNTCLMRTAFILNEIVLANLPSAHITQCL